MEKYKNTAGVSLIIAIIFVSALMLVMAGLFEVNVKSIQMRGDWRMSDNARNLAESAFELGKKWAATHGVGRNTTDEGNTPAGTVAMNAFLAPLFDAVEDMGIENCDDTDGATDGNQPCVGFEVNGRPADAERVSFGGEDPPAHYSAPISGSGDAAEDGVDCSAVPDADAAEADHPCNWNRMYLGQTVEIPLYYEADGTVRKLFDPANGGATEEFRLRVRTPCENGNGADCNRLILYPSVTAAEGGENPDYRNSDRDPVLVQWSVFDGDGSSAVTAWDETAGGRRRMTADRFQNTELPSGRINLANGNYESDTIWDRLENFVVLQYLNSEPEEYKKHSGKKSSDKQRQSISEAINAYTRPTLRLSLVGQPQRNNSAAGGRPFNYQDGDLNNREEFDIPYLEYQLLTKNSPSSDTRTLIIGWAEIGGFRKEFKKYIKRATSASGFAIESF